MSLVKRKYLDLNWWLPALRARGRDLYASIGFEPRIETLEVNGIAFKFFVATPQAQNWYAGQTSIESAEITAFDSLTKLKGATLFECGGHHGRDCVVLAKMIGPDGAVETFEPHPENFEVLERNVELNGLAHVHPVPMALGAIPGEIVIRNRSNAKVSTTGSGITVPVTTVDAHVEQTGVTPDIIKVDVEGFELEVLRGAQKTLRSRPALMVEMHCDILEEFGARPEELWDLVDTDGYDVYVQWTDSAHPEPVPDSSQVSLMGRPHVFFIPGDQSVSRGSGGGNEARDP